MISSSSSHEKRTLSISFHVILAIKAIRLETKDIHMISGTSGVYPYGSIELRTKIN